MSPLLFHFYWHFIRWIGAPHRGKGRYFIQKVGEMCTDVGALATGITKISWPTSKLWLGPSCKNKELPCSTDRSDRGRLSTDGNDNVCLSSPSTLPPALVCLLGSDCLFPREAIFDATRSCSGLLGVGGLCRKIGGAWWAGVLWHKGNGANGVLLSDDWSRTDGASALPHSCSSGSSIFVIGSGMLLSLFLFLDLKFLK